MDKEQPPFEGAGIKSSIKDSLKQKVSAANKGESIEQTGVGAVTDSALTPSLLEEVLTEKKLALMRSPEVVAFLKAQQAKMEGQQASKTSEEKSLKKHTLNPLDS